MHPREAEIVAQAVRAGVVTVALDVVQLSCLMIFQQRCPRLELVWFC